jgi:hypothetical protein
MCPRRLSLAPFNRRLQQVPQRPIQQLLLTVKIPTGNLMD